MTQRLLVLFSEVSSPSLITCCSQRTDGQPNKRVALYLSRTAEQKWFTRKIFTCTRNQKASGLLKISTSTHHEHLTQPQYFLSHTKDRRQPNKRVAQDQSKVAEYYGIIWESPISIDRNLKWYQIGQDNASRNVNLTPTPSRRAT